MVKEKYFLEKSNQNNKKLINTFSHTFSKSVMNHNIITKIIGKYWLLMFRNSVLRSFDNNFAIINKYDFTFPLFAYVNMINFVKNTECKICNKVFQNKIDYYDHLCRYLHFMKFCNKLNWIEQDSELLGEIKNRLVYGDIGGDCYEYSTFSQTHCNDFIV